MPSSSSLSSPNGLFPPPAADEAALTGGGGQMTAQDTLPHPMQATDMPRRPSGGWVAWQTIGK